MADHQEDRSEVTSVRALSRASSKVRIEPRTHRPAQLTVPSDIALAPCAPSPPQSMERGAPVQDVPGMDLSSSVVNLSALKPFAKTYVEAVRDQFQAHLSSLA